MSIENIVTLFELLLMEYKLVFFSDCKSILCIFIESLCDWMYPLYWHHILIPILPARLINYLQAPVPFIVGIEKKSFPEWTQEEWRPLDVLNI
jgi:hypothetical protein